MRRIFQILVVVLLCAFIPIYSEARSKRDSQDNNSNGVKRVVVIFKDQIEPGLADKYGGEFIREFKRLNAGIFLIPASTIGEIKKEGGVIHVEIEKKLKMLFAEREKRPMPEYITGEVEKELLTTGIVLEWNLQDRPDDKGINAEELWRAPYNLNGDGSIIAFLDTGVNYDLEDLNTPKYLGGWNFVNNDGYPMDDDQTLCEGHGTAVTTIAVAEGVDKIIGAAPGAQYYALKVINKDGDGYPSDVIDAIDWVINHNSNPKNPQIDIISMSFGTYDLGIWHNLTRDTCEDAYNVGIILVAGVGNGGYENPMYPARFDDVMAVGGHNKDDGLYDYHGKSTNGGGEIIAPAQRVPSMDRLGDETWHYSGTSFAAPHVAGLLALALQYARENNIEINNGYQWEMVKHSAIDLLLDPVYQGKGKARAKESIDLVVAEWPLEYDFDYLGYLYLDGDGYPVYYIGTSMFQDITLTNNTTTVGNYVNDIENLDVTTTQVYHGTGEILPGDSTEDFESEKPIAVSAGDYVVLDDSYYISWSTRPGLYDVILDLEFNFVGNSHLLKITDNEASIWCPPGRVRGRDKTKKQK